MKSKLLLLSLLISSRQGFADNYGKVDQGLLWEVSGNGLKKPSYILGTFHLANYNYLDSIPGAKEKFIAADLLVTEIKGDSAGNLTPDFSGVYMKDTTLNELLTPVQYERFSYLVKNWLGMDALMLNNIRPAFVTAYLVEGMMMKMQGQSGFEEKLDLGLMKDAVKMEKKSVGLETIEFQMNVLKYLGSLQRQAEQLAELVMDTTAAKKQLLSLYRNYKSGNLQTLYVLSMQGAAAMTDDEMRQLLVERNISWLKVLPEHFQSGSCFVAVGALHLVGPNGLLAKLRAMGYTVKAVKK